MPRPTDEMPQPEIPNEIPAELLKRSKQDILYLQNAVEHRVSSFSWPMHLKFRRNPSNGSPYSTEFTLAHPSNRGMCGLSPKKDADTARLCGFEDWLIEVYMTADAMAMDTCMDKFVINRTHALKADVISALQRIDELKFKEWQRQHKLEAHTTKDCQGPQNSSFVDSSKLLVHMRRIDC